MLDTRRIADMTQYLMVEGSLQLLAALVEELELMGREGIEAVIIASHEVREHAARDDGVLMFQSAYQLLHIVLGIEAQAVHAGIQLDMHRETSDSLLLGSLDKGVEQTERVNLGLKIIIEHGLEGGHLWIHDHDIAGDTVLAKRHTFIGNSHGKIVHTVILQGLGYFHCSRSIAVGLDHADQLGLGLHKRAIVVQVGYHSIEVHLERGLMHLAYQKLGELVETKLACALEQDDLIAQRLEHLAVDKLLHIAEEELL